MSRPGLVQQRTNSKQSHAKVSRVLSDNLLVRWSTVTLMVSHQAPILRLGLKENMVCMCLAIHTRHIPKHWQILGVWTVKLTGAGLLCWGVTNIISAPTLTVFWNHPKTHHFPDHFLPNGFWFLVLYTVYSSLAVLYYIEKGKGFPYS